MSHDHDASTTTSDSVGNPLYHLFRTYGGPYLRIYALGLLAQLIQIAVKRVPEVIIGVAFDAVFLQTAPYDLPLVPQILIPEGRAAQFWFTVGILTSAYLVTIPLQVVGSLSSGYFQKRLLHDVRTDTYDAMQRLSLGYFDETETGQILSILNNDVRNLESFTRGTLGSIIRFPMSVATAFLFMALLNWQLAVVLLFAPVLIAAISWWYAKQVKPVYEDLRQRIGSLNAQMENNLSGIETIKAYTAEETEMDRVGSVASERLETENAQTKFTCLVSPGATAVKNLAVLIIVLLGGYWILAGPPAVFSGSMTAGTLLTFVMFTRSFVDPMRSIPDIVDSYEDGMASARRIISIHTHENLIPESEDAVEVSDLEGHVEYDNVSFAYEGTDETIRDVSFEAEPGETIGIVGPTGAGKSTVLKLLFRFSDVDDGTIAIDGFDVREMARRSLRDHLGYVEQEPFLFYGTVRENIAYGVEAPTDETVVAAAKRAGAHEFITELPEGYDTEVGERGVKLSGGQRQRVAIARALIRDPAVLVLDEATSHVDNETEAVIQHHLDQVVADRTTFVIAHRLSTVRDADRILVFDDGEIVKRGTHDELVSTGGLYDNFWKVQVGEMAALSESFVERIRQQKLEAGE